MPIVKFSGLATGGDGVGREVGGADEGRVVFVPLAAPGDTASVQITRTQKRHAFGDIEALQEPGPGRVEPTCSLFGRCGGCQWQHVDRQVQLDEKSKNVQRALRMPELRVEDVGPAFGYRDRARLAFEPGRCGFRQRGSDEIVDVPHCPLLSPEADAAMKRGRQVAITLGSEGELFVQAGPQAALHHIVDGRQEGAPQIDISEDGTPALRIQVGGFAQVGRWANGALGAAVVQMVGAQPGRITELYAGAGNFTRLLVHLGFEVTASDGDVQAMALGRLNVPEADWRSPQELQRGSGAPDTVVLDPPRTGLDPLGFSLALSAKERIVYLSCDPQTFARDRDRFAARGWRLHSARAFDLMPQTFHVEVLGLFCRD